MSNCSLSMVEGKLPPGFRFHPRDDELICDYLMKKLLLISPIAIHSSSGVDAPFALLIDVDLNKCEPWDLPEIACVGGKEWYFYSQRDRKYATGLRTNRATVSGYWKATGKDRAVVRKGSLVGMRKTLVFYQGRAPKGRKTDWVMHEFRLEGPFTPPNSSSSQEDWVLCRVFHKSRESVPPKPNPIGYDETGCSSLPALMDSYISFDHTDPPTATTTNDNDDNNNQNSLANYQQVPCFSINDSRLFHAPPTDGGVPMSGYHPPPAFRNDLVFTGSTGDDMSSGGGSSNVVPARDRHVIKAVLSHLTNNMEGSEPEMKNGNDVTKGSSPSRISVGDETGGSNSESYLSDLMWTSHY